MTINDLKYLESTEGQNDYIKYRNFSDKDLEVLIIKSHEEKPYFGALVSQIKLRRKAVGKFAKSEEMFFTSLSLEQSTSEVIARHLAKRFKSDWIVADLGCGLGGNTIFLAESVKKVIAVDLDEFKIECAKHNATVYGVTDKIEFRVGDANDNIDASVNAFFLDPARDRDGQTKTRSLLNSSPNLLDILPKLFAITKNVAVKISPAFDYEELDLLPEQPEVEIISEDNNCKVAMLWFGDFKQVNRLATCFQKDAKYTITGDGTEKAPISELKKYLYEPNKAISKAHLVNELANKFNLTKIDYNSTYLTSDELIVDNYLGALRRFKIVEAGDFSVKKLQKVLKTKKINQTEIIVKNLKITSDDLRSRLKLKEGGQYLIILLTILDKKTYILVEKVD
jgi:SAM-dependent methyltransferase